MTQRDALVVAAARCGIGGPLLLLSVIIWLSIAQFQFMRTLRWDPLFAPTTDWPSGLALGPYGICMTVTFILSGIMLAVFGIGLARALGTARIGAVLLTVAGVALALLAFPTDPTYIPTPRTLAGDIHDTSFAVLGIALIGGMFVLMRTFRRLPAWRNLAFPTLVLLIIIPLGFILKGLWFYAFLLGIIVWLELVAWRLLRITAPENAR